MILDISSWWQSLDSFLRIYWVIAILFSALFLVQVILSFAGSDADAMGEADLSIAEDPGVGSQYFTFKNVVAFFTMFGWVGVAGSNAGWSQAAIIAAGIFSGVVMVAFLAFLFTRMMRLEQSGTMQLKNAVGKMGNTYLRIPAARSGTGKVQMNVQGSVHELQALTDDPQEIATNTPVRVTGIIGNDLLLVTASLKS